MNSNARADAKDLADALMGAAFPAQYKDWGGDWSRQFHAGHVVALELLEAFSAGEDISPIVERWASAARAKDDSIVVPTRAGRHRQSDRFSWHWQRE